MPCSVASWMWKPLPTFALRCHRVSRSVGAVSVKGFAHRSACGVRSSDAGDRQASQITPLVLDRKAILDSERERRTMVLEAKRKRC